MVFLLQEPFLKYNDGYIFPLKRLIFNFQPHLETLKTNNIFSGGGGIFFTLYATTKKLFFPLKTGAVFRIQ